MTSMETITYSSASSSSMGTEASVPSGSMPLTSLETATTPTSMGTETSVLSGSMPITSTFTSVETESIYPSSTQTTYCEITEGMDEPLIIPDSAISTNDENAPGSLRYLKRALFHRRHYCI